MVCGRLDAAPVNICTLFSRKYAGKMHKAPSELSALRLHSNLPVGSLGFHPTTVAGSMLPHTRTLDRCQSCRAADANEI